ncbi:alkaline phosphatase D family protein [Draconibacterium sediminis]|uniref:alkaline phosphatase D family protein n=1 Tax=Draconibacterium sediminis TaxID=1544798 RepID=UPI0026ECFDC7|nr:alkaline phosphatase D family protein [Draconibacterium sediminis]
MKKLHFAILFFIVFCACTKDEKTTFQFDHLNDRVWIGEDFWSVPLENWQVKSGHIVCDGKVLNSRVNLLTYPLSAADGTFSIRIRTGLAANGVNPGSVGLSVGVKALEEDDVRAACYFGKGLNAGLHTGGFAFLGQNQIELPDDFDWKSSTISLTGKQSNNLTELKMTVQSADGTESVRIEESFDGEISGLIQLVNNFQTADAKANGPSFWFDDLELEGNKVIHHPGNSFGPILFSMYTLSRGVVKLTAQLPPLGEKDSHEVEMQLKEDTDWVAYSSETIDPDSRTATFKVEEWQSDKEVPYRLVYREGEKEHFYEGTIRKEPTCQPLKLAGLTCQFHYGFPYSPLVKNLNKQNPDMLYFSGDQIYESNGGYGIIRYPEDLSILNYLGKYYMFGWAFRDLMRDRPTIVTPDDHDVYQGNLWGASGEQKSPENFNTDDRQGFAQSVKMVNAVNRTQCAHLPDPYDPTTIGNGMSVWYTDLVYGNVSFAIISDRIFKSGPDLVSTRDGRKDHISEPLKNFSQVEKPELKMLGDRQLDFLNFWIKDWKHAKMKVLLTQTIFANTATHHGSYDGYLYGDMDSGGWPKSGRDKALKIIRKAAAFQVAGDQHLPSVIQYGIDDFQDAGWCFCTPAIAVGYQRWFRPDDLGIPVQNRPSHNLPNTGNYTDAFGNKTYVYAVGNPGRKKADENRYVMADLRSSGYGLIELDTETRNITLDAIRFLAYAENPKNEDHFSGWPLTISQFDNFGKVNQIKLPTIKVLGDADPVVEVINEQTGETESIVRIKGNEFHPVAYQKGKYTIKVTYPEKNTIKEVTGISGDDAESNIEIKF